MTANVNFLDQALGKSGADVPVGGIFTSDPLVAPWRASRMYTLGCREHEFDYAVEQLKQEAGLTVVKTGSGKDGHVFVRVAGEWLWFTALERDYAVQVAEVLDIRNNRDKRQRPQEIWQFEAPDADIISLSNRGVFGDPAVFSLNVGTHGQRKGKPFQRQHEFHMIALPAVVAAMADVLGYSNPGFDLSELLSTDYAPTDANQGKFIGAEGWGDYKESVLWQRRAALWKALGEDNADVYNPIPVDENGKKCPGLAGSGDYKLSTGAEKLDACLRIYFAKWQAPIWCSVALVTDPRVDAFYTKGDETKRLSVPAIVKIYPSEEAARADVDSEKAITTSTTASAAGSPTVPSDWTDFPDDWKDIVRELKSDAPKHPVQAKAYKAKVLEGLRTEEKAEKLHDRILGTVSDVEIWWDLV